MTIRILTINEATQPNESIGIGSVSRKVAARTFQGSGGAVEISFDASDLDTCLRIPNEALDGVFDLDFGEVKQINRIVIQNKSVVDGLNIDVNKIASLTSTDWVLFAPTGGGFAQLDVVSTDTSLIITPASANGEFSVIAFF